MTPDNKKNAVYSNKFFNSHIKNKKKLNELKKKNDKLKFTTPIDCKKVNALQNSIQISKVKLVRESSLEKEFGYLNESKNYSPKEIFKIFPVKKFFSLLKCSLFFNRN